MFYITVEHKSSCNTFFITYCTSITNFPYFRYFGHVWPFSSKTIIPTFRNVYHLHAKNELHSQLLFWDLAKVCKLATLSTLRMLIMFINMIVSSRRKLWCSKCWNQLVGHFDVYLHAKLNFISNFFWDIVKTLLTSCF